MGYHTIVRISIHFVVRNWVLIGRCSILWTAVFGIFGKLYIHEHAEGDGGIKRMKNAVWIDLVNMLLWLISAVMASVLFFTMRGGKSLHSKSAFLKRTLQHSSRYLA